MRATRPKTLLALAAASLALACGDDAPAWDLDGGLPQLGQAYVAQRGCASCHEDPGAGTLAGQVSPRPGSQAYGSNLTPDVATGIGGWADVQIVRALRAGYDDAEEPLCSPMPRYADMSDLEARAIVAYLRSLPSVARAIPASLCPPLKPFTPDLAMPGDLALPVDGGGND